jgi:hypothetical protein
LAGINFELSQRIEIIKIVLVDDSLHLNIKLLCCRLHLLQICEILKISSNPSIKCIANELRNWLIYYATNEAQIRIEADLQNGIDFLRTKPDLMDPAIAKNPSAITMRDLDTLIPQFLRTPFQKAYGIWRYARSTEACLQEIELSLQSISEISKNTDVGKSCTTTSSTQVNDTISPALTDALLMSTIDVAGRLTDLHNIAGNNAAESQKAREILLNLGINIAAPNPFKINNTDSELTKFLKRCKQFKTTIAHGKNYSNLTAEERQIFGNDVIRWSLKASALLENFRESRKIYQSQMSAEIQASAPASVAANNRYVGQTFQQQPPPSPQPQPQPKP